MGHMGRLRNLGIVAHIDAGKTTVTERILFYSGIERRMGEVHEGTAVMDWMEEERRRGITITAAATTVPWDGYELNIIDTPGHVDFTVEVERCMRILDGAILVLNGVAGVQAQSETVWRQMQRHEVPYLVFVNQCDRPGADFFGVLKGMEQRLGAPVVALQLPLGEQREFRAVIDLLTLERIEFREEDQGLAPVKGPLPEEVRELALVLRSELLDRLAEEDEAVLQAVLEETEPPLEVLRAALRARVLAGSLVPAFCGAALRNVGVQPLLDGITAYLPSPLDVPPVAGLDPASGATVRRAADPDEPTSALAFKLATDAHEELTFVRVYSGRIQTGKKLFNPRVGRMERISRVLRMHADARIPLETAGAGDIVALTGLKFTATGDTLCDADAPIALESLEFPDPVITLVVEPQSTADRDKLRAALERLVREDPTFHMREDEGTGQWHISGMGELHLEVIQNRLRDEFRLEVVVGKPRVAYREAVRTTGRGRGLVDKLVGGKPVFGAVEVELLPDPEEAAEGLEWAADCAVPAAFRTTVAGALAVAAEVGPRFGFPLVQTRLRAVGGGSAEGRDSDAGFAQAAGQALREALQDAKIDLLEPLMAFTIETPAEFLSGIIADLNGQRADIRDIVVEGDQRRIVGEVPMAHMFGYATNLRSLSQGRADFSLLPAGFRTVPETELVVRGLVWS